MKATFILVNGNTVSVAEIEDKEKLIDTLENNKTIMTGDGRVLMYTDKICSVLFEDKE